MASTDRRRRRSTTTGVSRFPQLCTRLPPKTLERLETIADGADLPMWKALANCIDAFPLPAADSGAAA